MRTLLVEPPLISGLTAITGDEARHGRTVLRLRPGEQLRVADAAGRWALASVQVVDKQTIQVQVDTVQEEPTSSAEWLQVAVSPPKGNRWDDLLRGLTELGVGGIHPLQCSRSERAPKTDRATRITREALKQCRRPRLPQLGPMADIATWCASDARAMVCDPAGDTAVPLPPGPTVLLVGPEGGFSAAEQAYFREHDLPRLALGGAIMRIETAALAAAAIIIHAWEDHERHQAEHA
jgi:16S rRNA (uracil1498-N3)-methyltransferase